jgi:hypothetical protein
MKNTECYLEISCVFPGFPGFLGNTFCALSTFREIEELVPKKKYMFYTYSFIIDFGEVNCEKHA